MGKLYNKLTEYAKSDYYPYHMPGHKRNMTGRPLEDYYAIDITEIDGFDNLHQAEGILLETEKKASRLYGADETFLLINGSTGGILAAISAAAGMGGKILIARNCHKSVYHAAYLRNLEIRYVYPDVEEQFGIALGITPEDVEEELKKDPEIKAVVITSPTYEGILSDIEQIAKTVHRYQIPLIVDEAHGAHLGFREEFPEGAVKAGADAVIHSLHKTLPAPTQTALLHTVGNRINREVLKRYLGIYQTSSPSYPLMAGMELCFDIIEKEGARLFDRMLTNWEKMLKELEKCRKFKVLCRQDVIDAGMKEFDVGKLVISTANTNWSGQQLYEKLLETYHLQMEMAAENYVLAMFTVMDGEEGYERLTKALLELDKMPEKNRTGSFDNKEQPYRPKPKCRIAEALDAAEEWIPIDKSEGRTAAGFINLYPPGIPVVVPGETYTMEIISNIKNWNRKNLAIQGISKEMKVPVTVKREEHMNA